jgi:predicted glycosyltransferase
MSILFFCQHFHSLGLHVRTLSLCKELLRDFAVDYLHGTPLNLSFGSIDSPRFRYLRFPVSATLAEDREKKTIVFEGKQVRNFISPLIIGRHYDFFITGLFPFTKFYLLSDILFIFNEIKKVNPKCRLICSMRDTSDKFDPEKEATVCSLIQSYYDAIFVHSDPTILPLGASFHQAANFANKIFYTGFIPNKGSLLPPKQRSKKILVSMGSGGYGEELARSVINIVEKVPGYIFTFVITPNTSSELREQLQKRANDPRIELVPFIEDFQTALQECALSISTGGSSLIDIVYTQTAGLVYPSGLHDQFLRTRAFAEKKLVRRLRSSDLNSEKLSTIILEALNSTPPAHTIAMDGAENTRRELFRLL